MISVLYVDDEQDLLEIARLFLERSGEFRVGTSTSAQEALDLLSSRSYDAIISDYQMPGMDGIAFLKAVRERFGDIPFILFTGRGREEVVIDAINNGADFYLQKGGNPQAQFAELSHKIHHAVRRKQAEQSLNDSERRLSDIIDFLPDATFAIDRSGRVIAWNRAIEEMTGIYACDMLGKGDFEYAVPFYGSRRPILIDLIDEPDEKFSHQYSNIYRAGNSLTAETDLSHPKGNVISVLAKVCPLYNQEGEITGAIESIRDITTRKKDEEELQKISTQLQLIFKNMINAFIVWESVFDGNGKYISFRFGQFNDAYARIAKVKYEDVAGKDVFEVWPATEQSWVEVYGRVATTGIPTAFDMYHEPTKGWYHCNAYRPSDSPSEVCVIFEDITERRRAGEALRESESGVVARQMITPIETDNGFRSGPVAQDITDGKRESGKWFQESEERFRSIVENADDIIYTLNPGGYFTYVSPKWTELLGHDSREVIGQFSEKFVHSDDLPMCREAVRNAIRTGKPQSGGEYRVQHKDGTWQWHSQRGSPIRDAEGRVVSYLGIARDITERKKADEALRQANRQLNLLTGITRHDIRNQLYLLKACLDLSKETLGDAVVTTEYITREERALAAIERQITLTEEYQDLGTHEPVWIDPDTVIPRSHVPGIITLSSSVQGMVIYANPMLEKVFFNLLENSARHGQRVTEIRVSSFRSAGNLILVWEDNGTGIAADEKERIFERGFGRNTGLGMFLVREILSLTGITISENGEPGRGARFEICVPRGMWRSAGAEV